MIAESAKLTEHNAFPVTGLLHNKSQLVLNAFNVTPQRQEMFGYALAANWHVSPQVVSVFTCWNAVAAGSGGVFMSL